jgi:hypothetical protein
MGRSSIELSRVLMKNWLVAVSGAGIRAMEIVPRVFLRPLVHSFLMGGRVFFLTSPGSRPPPWMTWMFPRTTRWKIVPSKNLLSV